ncbi:hypothetical protein Ddc_14950 [Ditylenchus destructor]|nr:hypothetical protein Ddc_14950 [Ditylenchus destructor]
MGPAYKCHVPVNATVVLKEESSRSIVRPLHKITIEIPSKQVDEFVKAAGEHYLEHYKQAKTETQNLQSMKKFAEDEKGIAKAFEEIIELIDGRHKPENGLKKFAEGLRDLKKNYVEKDWSTVSHPEGVKNPEERPKEMEGMILLQYLDQLVEITRTLMSEAKSDLPANRVLFNLKKYLKELGKFIIRKKLKHKGPFQQKLKLRPMNIKKRSYSIVLEVYGKVRENLA